MKQNEAFTGFKTVGEFGQAYLDQSAKVTDLTKKLEESIPKLPDDASDEDRATYYDALGRPTKASEYEFDGEDKNAPEWTEPWKQDFYEEGLTKTQALNLSKKYNARINKMVDDFKANQANEIKASEQRLRTELGDKYDTNVELAKRLWKQHGEGEFDQAFAQETSANRFAVIRMILKFASLTSEDTSPQGGHSRGSGELKPEDAWLQMYKNPVGVVNSLDY